MEAVPRLPMLSFDLLQSAELVEFGLKLKQFIRSHYGEDPELFNNDINQLEGLRSSAVHPTRDVAGCSTLKRYYCQLHFLSSRFPMHSNEAAAVKFSWKDFNTSAVVSASDITLEMSSILYNIGALHTQLGAADNRTTAEGMKMSCTHFQCAAWAFQHVCEEYAKAVALDLSLDLMTFMAKLCLGQAQECLLEKSMMDNRKATSIAKVSIQVVEYYKEALKIISGGSEDILESVGSKQSKKWEKYLKFKISYHGSIALLFQGQQAEEQQKMGERVAFYQASFEKLEEANKLAKGLDNIEAVNEVLTFVRDIVEGKRRAARNENEFIYHEDIPDISALPEMKGASLVKGIPFNVNDVEVSGPDIFGRLVPMKAHEASSLYSEEKAKLLRKVAGMIENKDEELETFLSTLQLDDLKRPEGNHLPPELIDRSAALSAKPDAIQNLLDSMNKLSSVYHDVEAMLQEIREMLNEEEMHEKEYQEAVGKRPPTIAATDLTREAKKYQEAHSKASESNQTLHKAMVMHIANMKLLSLPPKELIKHIPAIVESPEVETITNEMRHLVDKVNEMKQQRIMLSDRLREAVRQDDILRQVVTYNGENLQSLFETELQKHQAVVSLIEQNLNAQENILKAVKETYARYGTTRKGTSEMHRRRESMITSLIASYDAYEDLLAKSAKGLDFYKKLEVNVSKLLQRVKGTCKVQDEEREEIIKNVKSTENPELNTANTLKLKDYLDMKKEFGKLSLDNAPVPPLNPYYKHPGNDQVTNQTWIRGSPGVRPAPVGSEGTEATRMDSLSGLYQGRGQEWSTAAYADNVDDKTKFYQYPMPVTSEVRYSLDTTSPSMPQDIYPISAYSSVMQNTSNTGYTGPKSNYYNTQNSPSRYINPPHFYSDYNSSGVTNYEVVQVPVSGTYTSPKSIPETVTPRQPTAYTSVGCSYQPSVPPQSVNSAYAATAYTENQVDIPAVGYVGHPHANYQYSTAQTENKSSAAETVLPQSQYHCYSAGNDPYKTQNPTITSQYGQYDNYIADSSKLPNSSTSVSYGGVQPAYPSQAAARYITPQTYQIQNTSGTYVTPLDQSSVKYYTSESNIASYNPNPSQSYSMADLSKVQGYPHVSNDYANQQCQSGKNAAVGYNNSWQQNYEQDNVDYQNNPNQHLHSWNESLYTACQTDNYSLTNSDVYKTADGQYATDATYGNQYYINQYGTLNGQNEYGLNYGNSATYIQAGADKQQAMTKTTYTSSDAKSSPSAMNSNVDLLAGLDFNISQSPLIPETSSLVSKSQATEEVEEITDEKTEKKPALDISEVKIKRETTPQVTTPTTDSFVDVEKLNQFSQDVEKYEKFVESLTLKTLNGPTCLDLKWKEISDLQDKSAHLHIISVARCYPMKNRFPDILPYDDSRIELPSTKDDYINASLIKNLSSRTPDFILTQAPLPSTYGDFWAMVFEQQVEIIVCLLNDSELEDNIYWPMEKGQELSMGKLKITLQSSNLRPYWVERIMSICVPETRLTRIVIHLQFTSWPGSSFPESPGPFLSFVGECINFFNQQRSSTHPVVVHCISGVGRTGLFCLIVAAVSDIQNGKGIPDLVAITGRMSQYRKSALRDREHLKFAYQAVLYYCQDLLMKRGILTNSSAFDEKKLKEGKCHTRHPSQDFLLGSPTDLSQLQSGIEKMGFECPGVKSESFCRAQSSCSRHDSVTTSCTSSGRTSPSSLPADVLSTLDPATFTLKLDGSKTKKSTKKRYSTESFTKKSELSLDGFNTDSDDPLSRLDPLWTMKK